ncbi:MAG TPA: MraY family glycosyltransferase [Candidatus Saccharimonadales bacterium]|nr:MraY family glycosyltransferase [Candidatus Saccharimonadales bacterium]
MVGYVTGFGAALVLSAVFTWQLSLWARAKQLFIPPIRERDVHKEPTPRVGGIAIVGAFLLVVMGIIIFQPSWLFFVARTTLGIDSNLLGLVLAVILLAAINIRDDLRGVSVWLRLLLEIVAAALVFAFGIRIPWLSSPLGGQIILGGLEWLFVVVWLVGLSNVVNWLDGINGLAAGVAAIALAILFFLAREPSVAQYGSAMLSVIALGAVVGFLPFNFGRARAFLGDTGSVFLGFLIGVMAIISGGKVATAFLVLAIPFLDAIVVFGSRLIHRQSPFKADRRHLHHQLLKLGFKQWQIVTLFYGVSLLFGLIALNTQTLGKYQASLAALALMAALILVYSYVGKRDASK